MSVLLSIKPKYVEEIEKGAKLYEFRKTIFKKPTEEIWVYSSAPIKMIVGKIYIDSIIEDTPEMIWKTCKKYAGIEKKSFFKYFEGKEKAYAIAIKKYEPFKKPINPYLKNNHFVPPQSYAYLSNVLPNAKVLA
jgi:type I restriction enzyme S subunit